MLHVQFFRVATVISLLVAMGWLQSCSSGKKSFTRGNYAEAVRTSSERLKKSPNHKKAQQTLSEAYPMAVKYHLDQVKIIESSTQPFKAEKMWDNYQTLNELYEAINTCPACLKIIPNPENFYSKTEVLKTQAAEDRYQAGLSELAAGTRERAKEAYRHFQKAHFFIPNYKGAEKKMEEALLAATLKVIVEQPPAPAKYSLSVDFFTNKMQESFFRHPPSEFVRFFSPAEAQAINLRQPDQIIFMQFDDFSVGETHNSEKTNTITKKVMKKIRENGQEREVEMDVKAEYTEFERNVLTRGILDVRVVDVYTQKVLYNEKFPAEYIWSCQWATYKGDSDALTEEQLKRTQAKPTAPPNHQFMFAELCNNIYARLTESLKQYYQRFN
ncbi:MAG: hypothetical protein NZ521_06460 [Flammeovirgaceae bacterium]|nr:hypothetical protein [Flammeovirgaceae bacterium]